MIRLDGIHCVVTEFTVALLPVRVLARADGA